MKTIIKTTLSLGLLALLSGCASNNGVDEYTLDSVNSNWYNTFKSYRLGISWRGGPQRVLRSKIA